MPQKKKPEEIPAFAYRRGSLYAGPIALETLARRFGTPLYVYRWEAIAAAYGAYEAALAGQPHLICAAVKANGNLALLQRLARLGSGFDIVSGGELQRVRRAGGDPGKVVFSGVGKTAAEMDAALAAGILLFNVESEGELELLAARAAAARRRARFGLRVNPNIAAATHPHISTGLRRHKFGLETAAAVALYRRAAGFSWLEAAGISFHIGSQILDPEPFGAALDRILKIVDKLPARPRWLDIGGGLGIAYREGERAPSIAAYLTPLRRRLAGAGFTLLLEPGRRLLAPAGVLLTRALYRKRNGGREFLIVDAGHNDLIRPVLYDAYHRILPARRPKPGARARPVDVVGPVCETADFFARDRRLPPVAPGELLAILDAGAYGYVLASNYNARPRPAEVLVAGGRARLIRRRETIDDLLRLERQVRSA